MSYFNIYTASDPRSPRPIILRSDFNGREAIILTHFQTSKFQIGRRSVNQGVGAAAGVRDEKRGTSGSCARH